jgi:hypothetical protein
MCNLRETGGIESEVSSINVFENLAELFAIGHHGVHCTC